MCEKELSIGQNGAVQSEFWNGKIDFVKIWNSKLDNEQIKITLSASLSEGF